MFKWKVLFLFVLMACVSSPVFAHHTLDHRKLVLGENSLPLTFQGCTKADAIENLTFHFTKGREKGMNHTWVAFVQAGACGIMHETEVVPVEVLRIMGDATYASESLKVVRFRQKGKQGYWYMLTDWPVLFTARPHSH